ncbi:DUF4974 domain-containing protein [Prolixibacteraceae bacterium JC049]|nr:DUF4974 domain-containing protein [Prolixibacteraceae bacterium JC049]
MQEQITKYLEGRLSDTEVVALQSWLKQSEDNRLLFEEEKKQWLSAKTPTLDLQVNLRQVKEKLERKKEQFTLKMRWQHIAAIWLLGILIGGGALWFVQLSGERKTNPMVVETQRGQRSKVTLEDGTTVWLNADSKLEVLRMNDEERLLSLTGEAFFDVETDKSRPFYIKLHDYDVQVLGTSFNIMSYEELGASETTLYSGRLRAIKDSKRRKVKPGQSITWNGRFKVRRKGDMLANCWIDSQFRFDQVSVAELIFRLEKWYDVDIAVVAEEFEEITFSGVFKNEETIWQVLDILKNYLPIDYKRTGHRTVEILKK